MSSFYLIAVDLGGTQIRTARYTSGSVQEARVAMPTGPEDGLEPVLQRMRSAIRQVWPMQGRVAAIGIGTPGPVDFKRGLVRFAPNLGWQDVPLRRLMLEAFDVPVFVGNDADVAALGEHRFGAGRGVSDMVYLTISTGIGGGLILNNRLFTGGNGIGGEVGHLTVEPRGRRCRCGNIGCLETVASGTAIARIARERIAAGEPSSLVDMVNGNLDLITAKEVNEAGQHGDPLAKSVFAEAGMYLGIAIVNLMYLLNPSLFVLGGSVTKAGDLLLAPLRATVEDRAPLAYREQTRIVTAMLEGDVGLWGALSLCLMQLGLA